MFVKENPDRKQKKSLHHHTMYREKCEGHKFAQSLKTVHRESIAVQF